jgi:S-adenosylmethionine:tRNA ribosyltransferase-isomerase
VKTSDFNYRLPSEQIAQHPAEPRDASRLLVLDRSAKELVHTTFGHVIDYLKPGDLLVVNRSRVVPARLEARKLPTGGKIELLLLERVDERHWKALVGGKGLSLGRKLQLENGSGAAIAEVLDGAQRLIEFDQPLDDVLPQLGAIPLPPYIRAPLIDPERYQTVYSRELGSAAAPTAGLHFTPELLSKLKAKDVKMAEVTLHIGLDTFAPVKEADPAKHHIHTEWCQLSAETAQLVNETSAAGGRVVAVGTTSVRVLESVARKSVAGLLSPYEGRTDLFILPGFTFKIVDGMITNFHLPQSTLLMLVSAFAGRERVLAAYKKAVAKGYRFFSFGDAMLIL